MKFPLLSFYIILVSSFLQAQQPLKIKFFHGVGGNNIKVDEEFSLEDGRKIKLTRAEFYLCSLTAENNDGSGSHTYDDVYLLVNLNNQDTVYEVGSLPSGMDMKVLKMKVGVDSLRNHADPSLYPAEHPLAPKDPSMHWGWQGGYRFMAIEGLMDADGDGVPDVDFQFHNLGDELLYTTTMDLSGLQNVNTDPLTIALDYKKLFTGINMSSSVIQHGSGAKNKLMLRNATQNGFFKPVQSTGTTDINNADDSVRVSYHEAGVNIAVNNGGSMISTVTVYNAAGQRAKFVSGIRDTNLTLDKRDFSPGIYMASVVLEGNKKINRKLIFY